MKLPEHKGGLFLSHNEHRNYYDSAETFISERKPTFKDDAAKQRAVETDEVWTLQWYPDTPVSFILVAAPTLDEVLAYALEVEAADRGAR